jgi:hypothetical protein
MELLQLPSGSRVVASQQATILIEEINKRLMASQGGIIAIYGPPGTGKSILLEILLAQYYNQCGVAEIENLKKPYFERLLLLDKADEVAAEDLSSALAGLDNSQIVVMFSRNLRYIIQNIPHVTAFRLRGLEQPEAELLLQNLQSPAPRDWLAPLWELSGGYPLALVLATDLLHLWSMQTQLPSNTYSELAYNLVVHIENSLWHLSRVENPAFAENCAVLLRHLAVARHVSTGTFQALIERFVPDFIYQNAQGYGELFSGFVNMGLLETLENNRCVVPVELSHVTLQNWYYNRLQELSAIQQFLQAEAEAQRAATKKRKDKVFWKQVRDEYQAGIQATEQFLNP